MAVFTAIGAAIFGAGTFLAGVTAAALQLAAGVAVNLIAKSIAGEPEPPRFSVQGTIQGGDDVPRSINMGWNSTAGSLVYQNEWGPANGYSTRVIALGDVPVRELRGVEVDGSPVTLAATAHPSYGYPVTEYRRGGKDYLWIKFYDGTQTSADSFLVGTVSNEDRPYDSSRVGTGIPYVIATSLSPERADGDDKPLFNGFPAYKFSTYGIRLYDISKDSTAGGSGTQRWGTPSTWGGDGDFLPPVQIYNLLRGVRFNSQWVYGLQDVPAARLPQANWVAQINKARAAIAGPDGNEPTYRAGGELQVGAQIKTAVEALLTACQGRLVEAGGSYSIYIGEPDDPVASFTDGDIISTEEQSFTPFFGLADTINGVSATYPNPAEGWNSKTAPPLLRPDLEVLDGNRRLMASVSLDMVPYGGQVQRLMKSALLEALRARRHTLTLGPEFWVLEPGDIIRWTSVRNGYVDKLFRVDGVVDKANLDVIVDITEVDPSDYDWDQETDYQPVIDGPVEIVGPTPLPMTGWQVFPATILDDEGRERRPSIEVRFASAIPDVQTVRVRVRIDGTTDIVFDGEVPYGDPWKVVLQGQFTPNTAYEVQGIFVRKSGAPSEWSSWLDVTTPDVRLGPNDFYPIDSGGFADEVNEFFRWTAQSNAENRKTIESVVVRMQDQAGTTLDTFQQVRQSLTATAGDLKADYNSTITAAVGVVDGKLTAVTQRVEVLEASYRDPVTGNAALASGLSAISAVVTTQGGLISANADAILAVETSVDNVSAGGSIRFQSAADPGGGYSRIALAGYASGIAGFVQAGLFVDVNGTTGVGRLALAANQTVITAPDGTVLTLFDASSGTAYINNARIRDLTADNIDVEALTATDGFFDNVTITSAMIGTATIERLNIKDGAVTDYPSGSGSGSSLPIATETLLWGPNFAAPNGPFIVGGSGSASVPNGDNPNCRVSLVIQDRVTSTITTIETVNGARSANYNNYRLWGGLVAGRNYRLGIQVYGINDGNSAQTYGAWSVQATCLRR